VTTLTDYRAEMSRPDGVLIHEGHLPKSMVERPGEDATPTEIMEWMEESFTESLTEGIKSTIDEDEDDEESESK